MRRVLPLLLVVAVAATFAAGCGSSKKRTASPAVPTVPRAATQGEWITRLVDRFLRDMSQNLNVVNALRSPQVILYIRTGNQTTIGTATRRMKDLANCTAKLGRVGPPPAGKPQLARVYADFRKACPYYETLAGQLLKGIPLLASRDPAVSAKGQKAFDAAAAPSRPAARAFGEAIAVLQRDGLLRAYQGP